MRLLAFSMEPTMRHFVGGAYPVPPPTCAWGTPKSPPTASSRKRACNGEGQASDGHDPDAATGKPKRQRPAAEATGRSGKNAAALRQGRGSPRRSWPWRRPSRSRRRRRSGWR